MNLEEYFQRIHFHGSHDKADLATLKTIHKLHVMSIPFENLSIHCGERISMDLELIFNKLVRSKRGGWCLESNYLFGWVLREMGFNTTTLGASVYSSTLNAFFPGENHLINLVVVDGKAYITDVSFGVSSQVWEPLELISEKDQPQAAGVFCLTNNGDTWVLEKSCRKPVVMNPDFFKSTLINRKEKYVLYKFTLAPREAEHFEGQNDFLQTNPSSLFTNKSICSLQTPTGFRALVGWTFSEVTYKPDEGVDLIDMRDLPDDEIETVLREKFNVFLTNELKPQNQKACYTI